MKILYGTDTESIDVTEICRTNPDMVTTIVDAETKNETTVVRIPLGDVPRADIFTDPIFGHKKSMFVDMEDGNPPEVFDETRDLCLDFVAGRIVVSDASTLPPDFVDPMLQSTSEVASPTPEVASPTPEVASPTPEVVSSDPVDAKLAAIHQALVLKHGDLSEELPEQRMAARYLTGSEKVLEIGANVGRNTLVIAHILAQSTGSIVTLESDPAEAAKLEENLAANPGLNVIVEKSALSLRKLIQRAWDTKPFDYDVEPMPDDYQKVDTITLEELRNKYGAAAEFDTLILDCEGAFYYILQDTPEVLDGINLVLMENDYHDFSHKQFVDEQLTQRGFVVDYSEPGGWGPCVGNFFEVWSMKQPDRPKVG